MRTLSNIEVSKVFFKCNGSWYIQFDRLAMGSSLSVILIKPMAERVKFALKLKIPTGTRIQPVGDKNGLCSSCCRKVTNRSNNVQCERCRYWYHLLIGQNSMILTHQELK